MLKLPLISNLIRTGNTTVEDVGEGVSPGFGHPHTLLGNIFGNSGIVSDTADGLDTSFSDLLTSVGADVLAPGGIVQNIFNGGQIGTESLTGQFAQTVGDLPLVHEGLTSLSPVADAISSINASLVDVADSLSPGASHPHKLVGNIIGKSGIVEDVVDNVKEGDFSGLVADVYKDVLGTGGILDNLGDGRGTGLQPLIDELGADELADLSAVSSPIGSLLGQVNDTVGNVAESVAPGANDSVTLTGNLLGEGGVVDNLATNLEDGSVIGAVPDIYADLFGTGGVIHDLAEGKGAGGESVLPVVGDLLDGAGGLDGSDDILGAVLGGGGGLLGGELPIGGLDLPVVGDLLGGGLLSDITGSLDA